MTPITLLQQLLEEAAVATPGHTAVEGADNRTITFGQLNALSNTLRDTLLACGITVGDRVGLYLPKSIDGLLSIFGVLKSGAAYVPVDSSAPPHRNLSIFKDCAVRAIITNKTIATELSQALKDQSYSPPIEISHDILLITAAASEPTSNNYPEV